MANFLDIVNANGQSINTTKNGSVNIKFPINYAKYFSADKVARVIHVPRGSTSARVYLPRTAATSASIPVFQYANGAIRIYYKTSANGSILSTTVYNKTCSFKPSIYYLLKVYPYNNAATTRGLSGTEIASTSNYNGPSYTITDFTPIDTTAYYWLVLQTPKYSLSSSTITSASPYTASSFLASAGIDYYSVTGVDILDPSSVTPSISTAVPDVTFYTTSGWCPYGSGVSALYDSKDYYATKLNTLGYFEEKNAGAATNVISINISTPGNYRPMAQYVGGTWVFTEQDCLVYYLSGDDDKITIDWSLDCEHWSAYKPTWDEILALKQTNFNIDLTSLEIGGSKERGQRTIYTRFTRPDRDSSGGDEYNVQRSSIFYQGGNPVVTSVRLKYLANV